MMCGKQYWRSKEQIYPQVKNKTKKGKKYSNRASDLIWECFSEINAEEAICLLHRHKQRKWKCGVAWNFCATSNIDAVDQLWMNTIAPENGQWQLTLFVYYMVAGTQVNW